MVDVLNVAQVKSYYWVYNKILALINIFIRKIK